VLLCAVAGCFGGPTSDWPRDHDEGEDTPPSRPGSGETPTGGDDSDHVPNVPRPGSLDAGVAGSRDAGAAEQPDLHDGGADADAPDGSPCTPAGGSFEYQDCASSTCPGNEPVHGDAGTGARSAPAEEDCPSEDDSNAQP